MRKMKTVFAIDRSTNLATREVNPEAEWALRGEGKATIKFEGTAAMVKDGKLFKRWDRRLTKKYSRLAKRLGAKFEFDPKMLKEVPEGAIPCEEKPDPKTFHQPHWVPVSDSPEDKFFIEAWNATEGKLEDGTFELVGPKVQDNMYNLDSHELWKHGSKEVEINDLSFDGIKKFLAKNEVEGVVFHHPDGRMVKARRKDFFNFFVLNGGRKVDWRNGNIDFDS